MEQKRAKSAGSKKRQTRSGSSPNAIDAIKGANRSRSNENKNKKSNERRQSSADSYSEPFQNTNQIIQSYIAEERPSSPRSPSLQHTIPPPWKSQTNDVIY